MSRNGDGRQVFRITGARTSLTEDVRGRQRRYVISMLIRTVCLLLAVALWSVQRYVAWGALVAAVLLPYFAVIIANAGRERTPGLPSTFDVPATTPLMLGPGGTGGGGVSNRTSEDDRDRDRSEGATGS
ncbi:hypothetical protein P3T36_001624 [Kitasatospora sp. MAP12-15]|uniref:DUF3099 domain-containing protein n=1 Tax=unclassified Kitasatospora TaxID=2633591 RepID=UPI0024762E69|nr:DUF3099 domain-containing protein [Kitasatospora sp. MAP12-44]MDH6113497.1 hypothetical protein [Kitasatospora sp. MAP12-44]